MLEPDRLGGFWADVLGLEWRPYPHGEAASPARPSAGALDQPVPEGRP
jgi:hypothetical protein